jgi:hypothetical protein
MCAIMNVQINLAANRVHLAIRNVQFLVPIQSAQRIAEILAQNAKKNAIINVSTAIAQNYVMKSVIGSHVINPAKNI